MNTADDTPQVVRFWHENRRLRGTVTDFRKDESGALILTVETDAGDTFFNVPAIEVTFEGVES